MASQLHSDQRKALNAVKAVFSQKYSDEHYISHLKHWQWNPQQVIDDLFAQEESSIEFKSRKTKPRKTNHRQHRRNNGGKREQQHEAPPSEPQVQEPVPQKTSEPPSPSTENEKWKQKPKQKRRFIKRSDTSSPRPDDIKGDEKPEDNAVEQGSDVAVKATSEEPCLLSVDWSLLPTKWTAFPTNEAVFPSASLDGVVPSFGTSHLPFELPTELIHFGSFSGPRDYTLGGKVAKFAFFRV
ncbi:hypothetical protein P9112_007647 [Eukaryota sp. TZLM1-RC]